MQRPTGITILALADFLGGALSLVISCLALATSARLRTEGAGGPPSVLTLNLDFKGKSLFWIGLIGTGAALFKLVVAAGLWTLQPWGRQLALISGTLNFVTHLLGLIRGAITPSGVIGLLVNGGVLAYLARYELRRALTDTSADTPTTAP